MSKVDKKIDDAKKESEAIYNRVMSRTFHVAIQKGRIMGRMEAQGKSAEDISKAVNVPVESVEKMLNEDPNQYIATWHNEVGGNNGSTDAN
jgi:predicted transposase YdaD